jgi:hypothetical protein
VRHAAPDRATVFEAIKGMTILSSRRAHDDIRAQIAAPALRARIHRASRSSHAVTVCVD